MTHDKDEDEDICVICFHSLEGKDQAKLDCNHIYCPECIADWLV